MNYELYKNLSLLTRVRPERLAKSVANTITSMRGIEAIASIINCGDGLDIMARLSSDTPQVYSGVVTGIVKFWDGSGNIKYIEEAGYRLGLYQSREELKMLIESGLGIGSIIRVNTDTSSGQQLIERLEVLDMPLDARLDYVDRVAENCRQNDLSVKI